MSENKPINNNALDMPGQFTIGSTIRAAAILTIFMIITLPLMGVQWGLLKFSPHHARTFPHWYHRIVCRLLGIRLHVNGQVAGKSPVLIIANHSSWLDIPVLSALAPISFIAKSEVSTWPFISWLAKLQRTVFINRKSRVDVGRVSNQMVERFAEGDALVVFAEGTSTDGNRVLPFRSSLLSSAFAKDFGDRDRAETLEAVAAPANMQVQTLSVAYTHLHGIPLGRDDRKLIAWYGDMEILGHAWALLKAGPLDVHISVRDPVAIDAYQDRKILARSVEQKVRTDLVHMLYGERPAPTLNS